jgi:hypothetical protein
MVAARLPSVERSGAWKLFLRHSTENELVPCSVSCVVPVCQTKANMYPCALVLQHPLWRNLMPAMLGATSTMGVRRQLPRWKPVLSDVKLLLAAGWWAGTMLRTQHVLWHVG